ncbi:MAG: ATP-binding protein [Desulfopila sp.]
MLTDNDNQRQAKATVSTLESIEQFSARLASTTDLETLYENCVNTIQEIFSFDRASLLLCDDSGRKLIFKAVAGFPAGVKDRSIIEEGQGVASLVLFSGRGETVEEYATETRFTVHPLVHEHGIVSTLAVPMKVADKVTGVLAGYSSCRRHFTSEEMQLCQVLANHAAIAINNACHIASLSASERKRQKEIEALQEEREKNLELTHEFESIFATIVSGVLLFHDGMRVVRCNDKLAEIFGYDSAAQMRNMHIRDLHLSDAAYHEFLANYNERLVAGETVQTEYELKKKDGTPVTCRISGRAVDQTTPPDFKKGLVWLVEDISWSKDMEKEVLLARKLESVGVLAGGIGHDFNNILSAIMGNLNLAQRLLEPDHAIQEMLGSAVEASNRAKDLTSKLLLFTRGEGTKPGIVRLEELFAEYSFERLLDDKNELHVEVPGDLFIIKVAPDNLKAILQNLLLNANYFMPDGGRITVKSRNIEVGKDHIAGLGGGRYVEIEVGDNGSGIDPDILENIFDPYFTTKSRDSSRGSGLGLAIVHAIIKKNNGAITVASNTEKGTVFRVYLPALLDSGVFQGAR